MKTVIRTVDTARRHCRALLALPLATAALLTVITMTGNAQAPAAPRGAAASTTSETRSPMPQYDAGKNLMLPSDYRQWILVGSSLGLSYSEGARPNSTFNTTLMEPTAYRHFIETGEFRQGTMLALIVQSVNTNATPARQGQFASDVVGVEMAVKDAARVPEGWAYYAFGGGSRGVRTTAAPQPKAQCFDCHDQHAARDHVFTQFYGMLSDATAARR
jgi:hypothetical protein